VDLKPSGNHHAEFVLFVLLELDLVFQVGLARTKTDSVLSGTDPLSRSTASLFLAHVRELGTKARRVWPPKRERLEKLLPKDARTLNEAAGE